MQSKDYQKLLNCPFCGGEAHVQGHGYETAEYRVYCKKCGCSTKLWSESEDKAISAWNRRAQPASETLTIEQLREMDGEPVWVISKDFSGIKCGIISKGFIRFLAGERLCVASMVECGRWMAYRRKPEGSDRDGQTV